MPFNGLSRNKERRIWWARTSPLGCAAVLSALLIVVAGSGATAAASSGSAQPAIVTNGTVAGALVPKLTPEPYGGVACGNVPVGTTAGPCSNVASLFYSFALINGSAGTVTINLSTGVVYEGPGAGDYTLDAHFCQGYSTGTITMTAGYQCTMEVSFTPSAVGDRSATMTITASDSSSTVISLTGTGSPTFTATPGSLSFGDTTLGTFASDSFVLTNVGTSTETIDLSSNDLSFTGPGADDYQLTPSSNCPGDGRSTVILNSGGACTLNVNFYPGALGDRSAAMVIKGNIGTTGPVDLSGNGTIGYYQVDSEGNVATTGDAGYYDDAGAMHLNKPIVGMAATGDNGGYWLVASDGGIFAYGDAGFYGSHGGSHLNMPIVGMTASPDAGGYWFVASDGGVFAYGDAGFYGSHGGSHLNQPIVGMASTPDGGGYWLVASDGGIFSYGDAGFYGSHGGSHLNMPIVGMASTPDGGGYWLVASDGGIFSYGDAQFYGSTGAIRLNQPIVAMAAMPTGNGYWFSAADGGLFAFGDAPFQGSGVGAGLGQVVDMASDGGPTVQAQAGIPAIRQVHVSDLGPAARHILHFAGP